MRTRLLTLGLLLLVFALPALAGGDRVIYNGIDPWTTKGDGSTFADFSKLPIPAGFFCPKSEPFFGRIPMRGVPLVTGEAGALGRTDTIVQRLDNAVFNKRGVASTRIQVRAMTFESILPVKTACGTYKVRLALNGEQPITTMMIVRDDDGGGRFIAPIAVNIKMTFEPVGRHSSELLEITREIRFPPAQNALWADSSRQAINRPGMVLVDTDGDGRPDTYVPGTSNFAAGRHARTDKYLQPIDQPAPVDPTCHTEDEGQHCPVPS
jgi:hypothetical protein